MDATERRRAYLDSRACWQVVATGCWEWTAARNPWGYGKLKDPVSKRILGAHRVAYMAWVGDFDEELFVLHSCDNPPCINPEHLRLGTHEENMRDVRARRRHANTLKTHCSKGHEYTAENTRLERGGSARRCRTCRTESESRRRKSDINRAKHAEAERRRRHKLKEANNA